MALGTERFPGITFSVLPIAADAAAQFAAPQSPFGPRYYCPRCGPTNRIVNAHGRIICVVCEYDLACRTIKAETG